MKKILETKKEYEVSPSSSKSKVQVRAFVAAGTIATRGQYDPSQRLPHISRLHLDSLGALCLAGQVFKPQFKRPVQQHCLLSAGRGKKKSYKQMEQKGVIAPTLRPQKCSPSVELEGLITRQTSRAARRPHVFDTHTWRCLGCLVGLLSV